MIIVRRLLLLILILIPTILPAQIDIDIVYPKQGQQVLATEETFIYGNVSPDKVDFSINDKDVKVYPGGGFLAVLPVESGEFPFICVAMTERDTAIIIHNVYVPPVLKNISRDTLRFDNRFISPQSDIILIPGDMLKVAFKGTPKCNAYFSITGLQNDIPMTEVSSRYAVRFLRNNFRFPILSDGKRIRGVYSGKFKIDSNHVAENSTIQFKLIKSSRDTVTYVAPGKLSIDNPDIVRTGQLKQQKVFPLWNPHPGHQIFLPQTTPLQITGREGDRWRIRIADERNFWIDQQDIVALANDRLLPNATLLSIQTSGLADKTIVSISLNHRLPYEIIQVNSPAILKILLYGVSACADLVKSDYTDPLIKDVKLIQKSTAACELKIEMTGSQQWGYDSYYDDQELVVEINKKPLISGPPLSPLKDISICLDPGHNPDEGAIGPTRLEEKDINYYYCVRLKEKLEAKGAFVFLTRGKEDGISLETRPKLAAFIGADFLLSMHFNSVPDGADPYKSRGASTYYFHPQSYKLAYLIQQKLLTHTDQPNFGLRFGNFTVLRATQMISVLVEPSFIILPEDEIRIRTEEFKNKVCDAIVEAFEQFLTENK